MKTHLTAPPGGSFRSFLRAELARRCARNRRYSLRAFALDLGIAHATLSQMLRGKRPTSAAAIERLGARLRLSQEAIEAFLAAERRCPSPALEVARAQAIQWTADAMRVVSDWHHAAILELVRLKDFRPDTRWIGRVLGIPVDEVNTAVDRLLRLRLLEMTARDRWRDLSGNATSRIEDLPFVAVRRLAEQVGALSLAALRDAPAGLRDMSATTIAVESRRVPEAIERLGRLRARLLEFLDGGGERDDVYRLEIGLFPVTRLKANGNPEGTKWDGP